MVTRHVIGRHRRYLGEPFDAERRRLERARREFGFGAGGGRRRRYAELAVVGASERVERAVRAERERVVLAARERDDARPGERLDVPSDDSVARQETRRAVFFLTPRRRGPTATSHSSGPARRATRRHALRPRDERRLADPGRPAEAELAVVVEAVGADARARGGEQVVRACRRDR